MRRIVLSIAAVFVLVFVGAVVAQQDSTTTTPPPATTPPAATTAPPSTTPPAATASHIMTTPTSIKWGDPPPVFEKGAKFAVISGDPGAAGPFVARLKVPAGYRIMPHRHPTDEHATVISGTFALGMGEKFDKATMTTLSVGSYAYLPANMSHYVTARTAAVVQIHGVGPFSLTYVNPADDPSTRTAPAGK